MVTEMGKANISTLYTGPDELEYGDTEESLWKKAGVHIKKLADKGLLESNDLLLITDQEDESKEAALKLTKEEKGGIHITPIYNRFYLKRSRYEKKCLRKLDPETNAHCFYDLVPNNMGTITCDVGARFGKLGEQSLNMIEQGEVLRPPFASYLFWPKYNCLLANGYEDMTSDLVDADDDPVEALFKAEAQVEDDAASTLYRHLLDGAKSALSEFNVDFLSNKLPWNRVQLNSCKRYFDKLADCTTIDEMNEILNKLVAIFNPKFDHRKGITLQTYRIPILENPKKQQEAITRVIEEWEARINSMETILGGKKKEKEETYLSPFGNIAVTYATKEEHEKIRKQFHIGDRYQFTLYKINAPDYNKRFDDYCKEKDITQFEELIHGSRTGNWVSIIENGLYVPKSSAAVANGSAYGMGIYTARDFNKSLGYTDFHGSKWANGNAEMGYIGVYRTAYGKPYFPKGGGDYAREVEKSGCNCLDAKAGSGYGFIMDEIIFYHEEAVTPEYIIEFSEKD